jgi:anti-repressor protein
VKGEQMEKISVINFDGHLVDVYGTEEEPLFLAVDIAKIIDYSVGHTSHMLECVDPDEKVLVRINSANQRGGNHKPVWFLTEDGLYEVLFQSRKPIARRFKASVKETLKKIRHERGGGLDVIEEWVNHPDPYVDEWEKYNREHNEEMDFDDFLRMRGYTDDMLNEEDDD